MTDTVQHLISASHKFVFAFVCNDISNRSSICCHNRLLQFST